MFKWDGWARRLFFFSFFLSLTSRIVPVPLSLFFSKSVVNGRTNEPPINTVPASAAAAADSLARSLPVPARRKPVPNPTTTHPPRLPARSTCSNSTQGKQGRQASHQHPPARQSASQPASQSRAAAGQALSHTTNARARDRNKSQSARQTDRQTSARRRHERTNGSGPKTTRPRPASKQTDISTLASTPSLFLPLFIFSRGIGQRRHLHTHTRTHTRTRTRTRTRSLLCSDRRRARAPSPSDSLFEALEKPRPATPLRDLSTADRFFLGGDIYKYIYTL
jgi:hypothetical protein